MTFTVKLELASGQSLKDMPLELLADGVAIAREDVRPDNIINGKNAWFFCNSASSGACRLIKTFTASKRVKVKNFPREKKRIHQPPRQTFRPSSIAP